MYSSARVVQQRIVFAQVFGALWLTYGSIERKFACTSSRSANVKAGTRRGVSAMDSGAASALYG
jgi:hypothetical protein